MCCEVTKTLRSHGRVFLVVKVQPKEGNRVLFLFFFFSYLCWVFFDLQLKLFSSLCIGLTGRQHVMDLNTNTKKVIGRIDHWNNEGKYLYKKIFDVSPIGFIRNVTGMGSIYAGKKKRSLNTERKYLYREQELVIGSQNNTFESKRHKHEEEETV